MSTHFCHGYCVLMILFGAAVAAAAQPLPPPAGQGVPPAEAARDAREPGYLGLIGDERRDRGAGVRVVRVVEGSPAAAAGLEVGDLITAIDGQPVGSVAAMATQLQPRAAEDKVRVEINRAGAARTIEVVLGRRPPPGERPFEFGRIPERLPEPPGAGAPAEPG
jgi:predicted metalloprotease with PDZ domain